MNTASNDDPSTDAYDPTAENAASNALSTDYGNSGSTGASNPLAGRDAACAWNNDAAGKCLTEAYCYPGN